MALRTIPAMVGYGRLIEEVAPNALLVNFTNPVGIVMQALHDHTSVRAIGICDGPISMQRSVAGFLGLPREQRARRLRRAEPLRVDPPRAGRRRGPPAGSPRPVRGAAARRRAVGAVRSRARAVGRDAPDGVPLLLLLPGRGGGAHPRLRQLARPAAAGVERRACGPCSARAIDAGDLPGAQAAWERAMGERDATYFARERGEVDRRGARARTTSFEGEGYEGVATAVMAAAMQRRKTPLIVDVANRGAIGALDDDDVVEVTCLVDEHGAHPIAQGRCPTPRPLLTPGEAVRAADRARPRSTAPTRRRSRRCSPTRSWLPTPRRSAILDDYVADLPGLLPALR